MRISMGKIFVTCLKELFRPVRILRIWRYYKLNKNFRSKHVKIGMGTSIIASEIEDYCFIGEDCQLISSTLGRRSYMNEGTHIRNARIGAFVSIGSQVRIGVGKHPTNLVSTHPAFYANNKAFMTFADKIYVDEYVSVSIGNDVWIGSSSTILGNVKIGDGAIVAFGAVVTKDVPPYAIVGGIPAKILKYRFLPEIIDRLLQIKWWMLKDDFLQKEFKLWHNPSDLIGYYDSDRELLEQFRS